MLTVAVLSAHYSCTHHGYTHYRRRSFTKESTPTARQFTSTSLEGCGSRRGIVHYIVHYIVHCIVSYIVHYMVHYMVYIAGGLWEQARHYIGQC